MIILLQHRHQNRTLSTGRYSEKRVRNLIERYPDITYKRTYGLLHAELIDIDRAVKLLGKLQPEAYKAVLLCGLLGFDLRTAGTLLSTPIKTLQRRYNHGIVTLNAYLNTGRRS